jgi:hypothetical protein
LDELTSGSKTIREMVHSVVKNTTDEHTKLLWDYIHFNFRKQLNIKIPVRASEKNIVTPHKN